jgi:NADH-quinone oxidoreductase subunit J
MEFWVFWPTAVLSVLSAAFMIWNSNPVRSALWLVVNFFTLSVFYVLLDAHFLAAVQVIVYAGAIMVLFLFVIMLLGVDRLEDLNESAVRLWTSVALGFVLVAVNVFVVFRGPFQRTPFTGLQQANEPGNVEALGRVLFSKYLLPFEVTSLLLIVAAVGAMVIGKRRPPERVDAEDEDA